MTDVILSATGISKTFEARTVLEPLDLELKRGKILVVLGQSGSGKSTLLRICMGLISPTTGYVEFAGARLAEENVCTLRRSMGYVIQEGGLFPHLTARENVLLLPRYLKKTDAASAYLLELTELTQLPVDCLDRFPAELSGGQRQRVSLMRALILKQELLFLDEPLGALDPLIRADLQEDLRRICRSLGKTVVLVTHDLAEAQFFGDEIWLMKDGVVVQRDTFNGLVTKPADDFVRRFIQAQRGVDFSSSSLS